MRLRLGYLTAGDETAMLRRRVDRATEYVELSHVTSPDGVLAMRESLERVEVTQDLLDYIVAIVTATRRDAQIQIGASPRGGLAGRRPASPSSRNAGDGGSSARWTWCCGTTGGWPRGTRP